MSVSTRNIVPATEADVNTLNQLAAKDRATIAAWQMADQPATPPPADVLAAFEREEARADRYAERLATDPALRAEVRERGRMLNEVAREARKRRTAQVTPAPVPTLDPAIRNAIADGYKAVCAAFIRKGERQEAYARRMRYFTDLIGISLGTIAGRRSAAVDYGRAGELAAQVRAALDAGDDAGALRLAGAAWSAAAAEWTDRRYKGSK